MSVVSLPSFPFRLSSSLRACSSCSTLASLFLASSRCFSGDSLSPHARTTFDLYAHKSHFAVAIQQASGAIQSLYCCAATPFVLPFNLVNVPVSSSALLVPFRRHQPRFFDPPFLVHPLFLWETPSFCSHFAIVSFSISQVSILTNSSIKTTLKIK